MPRSARSTYIVDDARRLAAGKPHVHGLTFGADFADESITFETRDRRIVRAWRIDGGYGAIIAAEVAAAAARAA